MPIDYSKWKDIEISDDEDDTHPNIDTPSLFKWRHEARVQRQKEAEEKKKAAEDEKREVERKKKEIEDKMKRVEDEKAVEALKETLAAIEKEEEVVVKKIEEIYREEKMRPWDVDTISKDGFSKTVINKPPPMPKEELTEEEREEKMKQFVKTYEKDIKKFGMMQKFEDSKVFLRENQHLACEETANYLVIWCINLAMEEKFSLMDHVAHQTIAMQYLLELAKQLSIDPRACITSFFSKIQVADEEYKKSFTDELKAFKERIRRRAKEKIAEQIKKMEESGELEPEEEPPVGPGGLNPMEVFDSLPETLQKCFKSQDVSLLQQVIKELPEKEARYHMKRCIDSGLWVPAKDDPHTNPEDGFRQVSDDENEEDDEEGDKAEDSGDGVDKKEKPEGGGGGGESKEKKETEKEEPIYQEVKEA